MSERIPKRIVVLFLVLGVVVAMRFILPRPKSPPAGKAPATNPISRELMDKVAAIEAQEAEIDRTVWAKERLAEQCGRVFEDFWDVLNASTNKLQTAAGFRFSKLLAPVFGAPELLPHRIVRQRPAGASEMNPDSWRAFVSDLQSAGWDITQIEIRHNAFSTTPAGLPRESVFWFSAHLTNSRTPGRIQIDGDVAVEWAPLPDGNQPAAVAQIDASKLQLRFRQGDAPFKAVLDMTFAPPQGSFFIDPLILRDLDGDGLSEIILASANNVVRLGSGARFETMPLCDVAPGLIFTAMIADFDGDSIDDLLSTKFDGLFLLKGSPAGGFELTNRLACATRPRLKYGQAMTSGDIDRDGDLDVWLGQYKVPYLGGQMPTPWHDANDGNPAFLFINDGKGNFSDGTQAAGLEKKRWRRTYSSSFADIDEDGDLDLLVVSDFYGIDLYANDGTGKFRDVTAERVSEPHASGMAHALADFDRDGRLDILMMGMGSPTVSRLRHLGLVRPGHANDLEMQVKVMSGNRLYLAQADRRFIQTALSDSIAQTGWSWGCGAADFDNDGFTDVYVANGHETKPLVREYEPEFWLHDVYVADSRDDPVRALYFAAKSSRTRGQGWSYGGHERNRMLLNRAGKEFVEIGHLMGVALPEDCRNVVADDLDGDGRMDLLVTTFEAWPSLVQRLIILRNAIEKPGNWIGFRFDEKTAAADAVSAVVTVHSNGRINTRQMITGDSFRSQAANGAHFGLGDSGSVDRVEVKFANGGTIQLDRPAINRWHDVGQ